MIKHNITTTCPSYKELVDLDSSNTYVSGEFVIDENGYFHRANSPLKESWAWYDWDNSQRIFVDPPLGMLDKIKMIYIQSNFYNYFIVGDMTQKSNIKYIEIKVTDDFGNNSTITRAVSNYVELQETERVIYHDRHVDKCRVATINADKWKILLPDTINYMQNECDESYTNVIIKEIIPAIKTEIDYSTSPAWKYKLWLENAIKNCTSSYGAC